MKTILQYPKIGTTKDFPLATCVGFEKYDGTNLHFDWHRDFGWHAFGTRRDEFNFNKDGIIKFSQAHKQLREAPKVFSEEMEAGLSEVLKDVEEAKVFLEFFGERSFAGLHKEDDPKELKLFDVWIEDVGIISPDQFISDFGHLNSAKIVYRGKFVGALVESIRIGKVDVKEGVVFKTNNNNPSMAKVKTNAYLEKLQEAFGNQWERHWE